MYNHPLLSSLYPYAFPTDFSSKTATILTSSTVQAIANPNLPPVLQCPNNSHTPSLDTALSSHTFTPHTAKVCIVHCIAIHCTIAVHYTYLPIPHSSPIHRIMGSPHCSSSHNFVIISLNLASIMGCSLGFLPLCLERTLRFTAGLSEGVLDAALF